MTSGDWRPFGHNDESEHLYDALHDGVPPWMRQAHFAWQKETLTYLFSDEDCRRRLHRMEQDLRCEISIPSGATVHGVVLSVMHYFQELNAELRLTDYVLSLASVDDDGSLDELMVPGSPFDQLGKMLARSGSMWTVGLRRANRVGLVHRVPEGVQITTDAVIRSAGVAGRTLALAWGEAFGLEPNPREAYRFAVEAVEDAAIPVMGFTAREKPTLGHVIRKMNGTTFDAAGWTLPFQREDEHYSNGKTVVAMLKTLWAGQADRHGGDHEHATKMTISQEAAESAVLLAVPLIRWFTSGSIQSSKG
jgi:hypothetical protein